MTADGSGAASHAGSRLLADLADRTGLSDPLGDALAGVDAPAAWRMLE